MNVKMMKAGVTFDATALTRHGSMDHLLAIMLL